MNFPAELPMEAELPPLEETPRLTKTINRMIGILQNNGYANELPWFPEGGVAEWMQMLEGNILEEMRGWIANPQLNRLETIFHRVQCWGGSSGRNIYVMGGGFDQNFDDQAYTGIANTIANDEGGEGYNHYQILCQQLFGYVNEIGRFGISFATKHFCFWSRAAGSAVYLPIYDRILANSIMEVNQPTQQDYPRYCQGLVEYAQLKGVTPYTAERYLFNYFAG